MCHGPLRLHKRIDDGLAHTPGAPGTETYRDVVLVPLQIEGPDRRGSQIPALRKVVDDERLHRRGVDGIAVALACE
ncbi:hypothetical protein D3C81_2022660 [compost metagenome]